MTVTIPASKPTQYSVRMTDVCAPVQPSQHWFVLRVTYQRELITKKMLDEMGITSFLPMQRIRRRNRQGRFTVVWEVAVHNYIFVYTDKPTVDSLKHTKLPWLRYCIQREGATSRIMTVAEQDMKSFIAVAGSEDEHVQFLDPQDITFTEGDRVRILSGPFEGTVGHFVRLRGKRDKCVVVRIEGIIAVATAAIPVQLVEKLN